MSSPPALETLRVRALAPQIASLAQGSSLHCKAQQHELPSPVSAVAPRSHPDEAQHHHNDSTPEADVVLSTRRTAVDTSACCEDDVVISLDEDAAAVPGPAAPTSTSVEQAPPDGPASDLLTQPPSTITAIAFPKIEIDRYGFLISDKRYNKGIPDAKQKELVWLENRRTHKWVKMIGKQLEDWEVCQLKNAAKLKQRIRKGIPEALRGRVWCHLAGSTQMMLNNPGVYRDFLQAQRIPCEETIARDIGRTFPKHYLFHDRASVGQCALMNVLRAYSLHDPEVGYCQGMGFLTAMFLSYMPEEQSFWHLVACLNHKRYDLAGLYRPRMPKVPEVMFVFERLLATHLPVLARHLESEGMHPTMYLTQWFVTLFTYSFPFDFVTRVWDAFLSEGWKVIFRVALALLKISQKALLAIKFEGIMEFFRELPTTVATDDVLDVAFRLPLTRAQLDTLVDAYQHSISS